MYNFNFHICHFIHFFLDYNQARVIKVDDSSINQPFFPRLNFCSNKLFWTIKFLAGQPSYCSKWWLFVYPAGSHIASEICSQSPELWGLNYLWNCEIFSWHVFGSSTASQSMPRAYPALLKPCANYFIFTAIQRMEYLLSGISYSEFWKYLIGDNNVIFSSHW